jgi:UDP-GlcNAc:undecaprenyl-phosphate GlcNAc-1-phosphate transferase
MGVAWVLARKLIPEWSGMTSIEGLPPGLVLASALLAGSLVMFLAGLWDDLKQFRPITKALWQLGTASLFVYAGGIFPFTGVHALDFLLTYFWFIGITNAMNMIDNMDGLSSGVAILAGVTIVILSLSGGGGAGQDVLAVPFALMFVAALAGFWLHNRPPASIFMGDSGSLFIGYVLAALTIPSQLNGFLGLHSGRGIVGSALILLVPAAVLAIPILDTTLVTITRTWRAQKAYHGGRDHSSHRLVSLGLSEKGAVWVLYGLASFGGAIAVLLQRSPNQSLPLLGLFALVLLLCGIYLGLVKVERTGSEERLPPSWTPFVSDLLYRRRAGEVLLDTVLIVLCFYASYLLRFDGVLPRDMARAVMSALPLVVPSCLLSCLFAGIYHSRWRLFSIADVPRYAMGVSGGTVLSLAVVTLATRFGPGQSRGAYIIFGLLLFLALLGSRMSFRFLDSFFFQRRSNGMSEGATPILIYGAGRGGKLLYEEVMFNAQMKQYVIMGFVDDDPNQVGRKLCGLPVRDCEEWTRQPRSFVPEIWISSKAIPDQRALQLAGQWEGKAPVRRLKLQMEPVLNGLPLRRTKEISRQEVLGPVEAGDDRSRT